VTTSSTPPPPNHPHPALSGASGIRLLVADPDLAGGLDGDDLEEAREQAVLPSVVLDAGTLEIDELRANRDVRGQLYGFLVLEGALMVNLQMSGRVCTRLIGIRELVLLDGVQLDSIPVGWRWSALSPTHLLLLDERLLGFAHRWPSLLGAVLERAAQQTRNAFLQQAISQLPRVEERLLALFWSVADRQGVRRSDGVWVALDATHETLAHMVGAQRPTVSLGLSQLAESGMISSEPGGWLLDPASLREFADTDED
jgi:hypothetical protein